MVVADSSMAERSVEVTTRYRSEFDQVPTDQDELVKDTPPPSHKHRLADGGCELVSGVVVEAAVVESVEVVEV